MCVFSFSPVTYGADVVCAQPWRLFAISHWLKDVLAMLLFPTGMIVGLGAAASAAVAFIRGDGTRDIVDGPRPHRARWLRLWGPDGVGCDDIGKGGEALWGRGLHGTRAGAERALGDSDGKG